MQEKWQNRSWKTSPGVNKPPEADHRLIQSLEAWSTIKVCCPSHSSSWASTQLRNISDRRVPTPAHFPSFLLWMEQTCHLCSLEEFLCPDPQLWHPTTSTLTCCEWTPNTSAAGPRWMYSAIQGQVEARLVSKEGVVRRLGDRTLCFKRIVVINCM